MITTDLQNAMCGPCAGASRPHTRSPTQHGIGQDPVWGLEECQDDMVCRNFYIVCKIDTRPADTNSEQMMTERDREDQRRHGTGWYGCC